MKKQMALVARFVVILVIAEALVSFVMLTRAVLGHGLSIVAASLAGIAVSSFPAAIIAASFISFFTLDRLFSSRIVGHAALLPLTAASLAGLAFAIRFLSIRPIPPDILPTSYKILAEWIIVSATSAWPIFAANLGALALLICSFWLITRLSNSRPLIGAFLAPSAGMAIVYLVGAFRSAPAEALFAFAGFKAGQPWHTAALAAIAALALLLIDALVARKPSGGMSDA